MAGAPAMTAAHDPPTLAVCAATDVIDGGRGVRFDVIADGHPATAFVVRHGGRVSAFLNRCAHVPAELDWTPGVFFDAGREFLMCATHGALYAPADGRCMGGACRGHGGLRALAVVERDGLIWWSPDARVRPSR